jgi:hypothetical protein
MIARALALIAPLSLAGCGASVDAAMFGAWESMLVAQGAMRVDPGDDIPFGPAELERDFRRVAFYSEFTGMPAAPDRHESPLTLIKWTGPVGWALAGDAAGPDDLAEMRALIPRLAAATGLTFIQAAPGDADIVVGIHSRAARDAMPATMRGLGLDPRLPVPTGWLRNDRWPCMGVLALGGPAGPPKGAIYVRAEVSGLIRRSCLHEEVAQMLGLPNDGDDVRPSIFNDDQEFALLTRHDEALLRILYDPRLRAGMTEAEGMPIVRAILEDFDLSRPAPPKGQ